MAGENQNWSNQSIEQLAKLSDQRLGEILKRARKARMQSYSKYRKGVEEAVAESHKTDTGVLLLPAKLSELAHDDQLCADEVYFRMVTEECKKRPHFGTE